MLGTEDFEKNFNTFFSRFLKVLWVLFFFIRHTIYIEMACNHLFGIGSLALVKPEDDKRTFTLAQAELAVFDRDVYNLILDVETLHDIAKVQVF